jgi:hypothetical protein
MKYGTVTVKPPQKPTKSLIKYRILGTKNCPIDENEEVLSNHLLFHHQFLISN